MDLDGKKIATTLSFQGFEGFIRTQNKNNFSIPLRAFFENPPFLLWLGHFLKFFN
jgi:hypothetical protein